MTIAKIMVNPIEANAISHPKAKACSKPSATPKPRPPAYRGPIRHIEVVKVKPAEDQQNLNKSKEINKRLPG